MSDPDVKELDQRPQKVGVSEGLATCVTSAPITSVLDVDFYEILHLKWYFNFDTLDLAR